MPTSPSSDKTPAEKTPQPSTLSDAQQPHSTQAPAGAGAGGIVLSAGNRPLPEYELVRLLGRGGFGEVWQARGPGGFDVALKFVRLGESVGEAELRALELMKGVRHAHLLPMFGAWQRDGFLIVAMELADGTLLDRLGRAREEGLAGIPREELLEYMREAAKGLDFLNEAGHAGHGKSAGIQHKDVKPQNLLLVGGTVKVADFGLARVLERTVMTASGRMTPAYAPPEFFKGEVTRWSDQYSLAMSYCLLRGGRLPFGGNIAQVMAGHLHQAPKLDMLPTEEEGGAVARALAKKPEQRWPSCRAFAAGLQASGRKGPPPSPFTNSIGMKFVWIKPSTFRMGSPPSEAQRSDDETPHRVTLTKGFHLGAHLVTQRQWEEVMGKEANESKFRATDDEGKKRLPVDSVSWNDCQEFCRKLGALEGRRYRLPTEAEWECACRAGTGTAFWWGDGITTDQANYDGNYRYGKGGKKGQYRQKPMPVDFFPPNPWGLHDMHGSLWQWCEDAYGPYGESDRIDPLNVTNGEGPRVLRGASWVDDPALCRAADRAAYAPGNRLGSVGRRVVLCLG